MLSNPTRRLDQFWKFTIPSTSSNTSTGYFMNGNQSRDDPMPIDDTAPAPQGGLSFPLPAELDISVGIPCATENSMASRCSSSSPSQSSTADHLSLCAHQRVPYTPLGWNVSLRPVRDALFHCLFARRVANIYNLGDIKYSNTGKG